MAPLSEGPVLSVRAAAAKDALAIGLVHVTSWRETYTGLLPETMVKAHTIAGRTAFWERALARPGPRTAAVIAEIDRGVVGFGSFGAQRTPALGLKGFGAEIATLYVLRAAQGLGVGRRLLARMKTDLAERGFTGVSLWVVAENTSARRFYERMGGEPVAEKVEDGPFGPLREVAYGWRTLDR